MGIMSHGVPHFVQDMKLTRGQRNDDFWRMYRLGMTPATPRISRQYQKFETMLQGAGVSLRKKDGSTQIFPATQKEIESLGGSREITKGETVDFDTGNPVPGGLFDVAVTGGQGGEHWSHVKLAEPLPNPLMEDPFRSFLGLTKDKYRDILAGREALNGVKGPRAIRHALETFNLPREIASTTEEIKAGKRSARDRLVKRLGYLKAFERLEAHPRDFLLDRVPVLPPRFRPVSKFKETTISADANYLYKDLIEANENLKQSTEAFGDENTGDVRLQVYDAFKAVVGLGNPIQPETQERNVRGLLKQIVGTSPKYGNFQRRVVGNPVDFVGRSVIIPGNHLDIDEVGLPVDMMWTLFKPFTIRKLSRAGMPMQKALQEWKQRTPAATKALMDEAAVRPVVINRAPTLHKYNLTGHFAKPVAGHAMQLSNLILRGHNADYDGDALNIHVPVGDKAVGEVKEKMLPSKMLYSTKAFDVHMLPDQGFVTGLYLGSHENKKQKPRTFASKADAVKAYRSGEIDADDPIVILRGT
jgi:DNA-directed RNA polymerase beta' subunit